MVIGFGLVDGRAAPNSSVVRPMSSCLQGCLKLKWALMPDPSTCSHDSNSSLVAMVASSGSATHPSICST